MSRPQLAPLGWLYGAFAGLRNAAFDQGILTVEDAGVPVISVGNVTAGGSGKTPLVEHIARRLTAKGSKPCVISRGYRRQSKGVLVVADGRSVLTDARKGGDEPVQIAHACPGVRVVVGERRVEAARVAVRQLGADVLVMDDGFQHRYLRRSLDIVVIDGRKSPFDDRPLPAGMLREWTSGIRRSHLVALSRSETVNVPWKSSLDRVFQGPVISFVTRGDRLRRFSVGRAAGPMERKGWPWQGSLGPLVAFSGIGDHSVFLDELRRLGIPLAADREFGDHHWYDGENAAALIETSRANAAQGFVTTEKDAARLRAEPAVAEALEVAGPLYTLGISVRCTEGESVLEEALDNQVRISGAGADGHETVQHPGRHEGPDSSEP